MVGDAVGELDVRREIHDIRLLRRLGIRPVAQTVDPYPSERRGVGCIPDNSIVHIPARHPAVRAYHDRHPHHGAPGTNTDLRIIHPHVFGRQNQTVLPRHLDGPQETRNDVLAGDVGGHSNMLGVHRQCDDPLE